MADSLDDLNVPRISETYCQRHTAGRGLWPHECPDCQKLRSPRKQTACWKTKDGTKSRICDLSDAYLANCIKYLENKTRDRDKQFALAPNPFHGDIAFDLMESEQDAILAGEDATDPADFYPIYSKLCEEREYRQRVQKENVCY